MSTYERDPAKRKVKPVETAQSLLDFDLEESSDDSDFRIEDHAEESDDCSIDSDEAGKDGKNNDDKDSEDSEISSYGCNKFSGNKTKSGLGENSNNMTVNDLLQRAKLNNDLKGVTADLAKMLICAGCLGSRSDDSNEIVECDGCGVTVHEGCYGVSDVTSESSTVSSASTEPWFCEACKAGVINPTCELCPNTGGIFKETEVGAWVHLVCALYVPGVAFSEVEKLSGVTLFEMAYSRWGARACCLCEDEMFSRTGICIGCDAGMCRTYFHVTCGQREGLLAEAHSEEVEQADPFYAHCRLHSDKTLIRKRKRNWLALQLRTQQRKVDLETKTDSATQLRTQRKLVKYRKKFLAMKETKNAPWVPTQKMPRLLPTSATACRKLLHKASLMGIDTIALEMQDAQLAALTDVRKKWHIPPAFSVEFIGYYLERNSRMETMKRSLHELIDTNTDLLKEQKELREEYDRVTKENNEVNKEMSMLKQNISKLYSCISGVCPNKTLPNLEGLVAASPPPPPPPQTNSGPRRAMVVPTAAALKMGVGFPLNSNPEEHQGKVLSTSRQAGTPDNIISLNNECGICRQKTDQHLLAKCDTCHLYYHLGCLKPPLTRLPKKSKLYGWQCSECDKSSESEAEVLEQKVARRSRARYSKDGNNLSSSADVSLVNTSQPEIKNDTKTLKILPLTPKLETMSSLKVKIKPVERPPDQTKEADSSDVFTIQDQNIDQSADLSSPQYDINKPPYKREKKIKKMKQRQGHDYTSSSADSVTNSPSKKSRKRSFTSPALTNTPLMSITPIVAESPHESPSHQECSNPSITNIPSLTSSQITTDNSFLSPNSTFSTLLSCASTTQSMAEGEQQLMAIISNEHDQISYKSARKRRKEKHRSRYSPDLLRSPTKAHKHKRKKKSLDIECPDIPHPRITIKIKPIPKPAGSVDPQLFYVPTDSNDGPPPAFLKKHSSKHHVEEPEPSFESPPQIPEPTPALVIAEEIKVTSPPKTKSPRVGRGSEGGRRSAGAGPPGTPVPGNETLTQCDVCTQPGTPVNLVRCDECAKRYHFTCLEPPLNKNPKKRGYSWHCADCDPTETDSN